MNTGSATRKKAPTIHRRGPIVIEQSRGMRTIVEPLGLACTWMTLASPDNSTEDPKRVTCKRCCKLAPKIRRKETDRR